MRRKHAEEAHEEARTNVSDAARDLVEWLGVAGLDAIPTRTARDLYAKLCEALLIEERATSDLLLASKDNE